MIVLGSGCILFEETTRETLSLRAEARGVLGRWMGMEFVAILRLLWRRRLLVTAAGLLALLIGVSMAYRLGLPPQSRSYQVGVGSVTALVDTPSSQVVDLGGGAGSDVQTLSGRASLLASLMTSSPIKDEIAARAGVAADAFVTIPPANGGAATAEATGDSLGSISPNDRRASILKASIPQLESSQVPIISVRTQAPDAEAAARLANDSIAVLQEHLKSVAGTDKVPAARRVVVRQLGPARSITVSRGAGKTMAIAVTIIVFLLACALIVGVSALARGWRNLAELERSSGDARPEYAEPAPVDALPADNRATDGRWRMPRAGRGDAPETSGASRGSFTGTAPRPADQGEAQDPARPSRVDVVNF